MIERRYKDEMICDLAEIYHIFDYKQFSMPYIAILVCGLPTSSRVIKKISKSGCSNEELLLSNIVDRLSLIWWSKTKDGQKNRNRPHLIVESLLNDKNQNSVTAYNSPEEFNKARKKLIEDKKNG